MTEPQHTLLIVEDNRDQVLLMRHALERHTPSWGIADTGDGEACLAHLKKNRPSLILLDFSLPRMDGLELLRRLKEDHPEIPVIMVTGHGNERIAVEAMKNGASDYLMKSTGFLETLPLVVHKVLEKTTLRLQLARSQEELLQRNLELTMLLELTTTMSSSLDLDDQLQYLAQQVAQQVVCTFVRILVLEPDGKGVVVRAAHPLRDLNWNTAIGRRYPLTATSCLAMVIQRKIPLLLPPDELQTACLVETERQALMSNLKDVQSALLVPLVIKEQPLGVIVVGEQRRWERTSLTTEKIRLCQALAHHGAIVLEHARLFERLRLANRDTIKALAGALETKDVETRGHSDRTVAHALALAERLGLSDQEREWIQYAAILHDIGKIGIPEQILKKPGKLTPEEFEIMKRHPVLGMEIIQQIEFLKPVVPLVRADHERWDGKGYPDGLTGETIPMGARIVAIVDAYDAMTSDRVYRKAPGKEHAVSELRRCAGTQFDPDLVKLFLEIIQA
jgi:putative nucleotidyltransferase with HDIG domain